MRWNSILIDEARTPLIISGPVEDRSSSYSEIDSVIPQLTEDDYELDEKQHQISFTESGNEHLEQLLIERGILRKGSMLYDIDNVALVHHANQALKAHHLYRRERDYIVKGGAVIIVDEFTGRVTPGRRYSDGLHQALEAKEDVSIQSENQTLASITFQNYFRSYDKLAGMTGTAVTEAAEFSDIYDLDVVEVPTNVPMVRLDQGDEVYRTSDEKLRAIVVEIADCHRRGQPVLVGTTSIEKSETLAALLSDRAYIRDAGQYCESVAQGLSSRKDAEIRNQLLEVSEHLRRRADEAVPIPHKLLNARHHEKEAHIIAQAGVPAAVTVATNMAGRGTDIQLGGNVAFDHQEWLRARLADSVEPSLREIESERRRLREQALIKKQRAIEAGGLYVIGTERHESRRIDNQLRGRSGRQGDPGRSKFYLSLDDDLMRIFGSNRMDGVLQKLGLQEGEAITHPWINKALEWAQQKIEARKLRCTQVRAQVRRRSE